MGAVIETERLALRPFTCEDRPLLCTMLQDPEVMEAYAYPFSDEEVDEWLRRQLERYDRHGYGLWAVQRKEDGELVGQCGLTWQDWEGRQVLEVGYMFRREHWHKGYAIEAAEACKQYAFETLDAEEVYSIIRDTNTASQAVAVRNGMREVGGFVKRYRGQDMPHTVYCVKRPGA